MDCKLTRKTSWDDIKKILQEDPDCEVVTSTGTYWWSLWRKEWLPYVSQGIPTDPLGAPLMQGSLKKFIANVEANPGHYGKYGLDALLAMFHGNVVETEKGLPTAFKTIAQYEQLLDQEG